MYDVLNNSYGHIFGAKIKINQSILYCVVYHSKQLTIQYTILSSHYERLQSLSKFNISNIHINIQEGYLKTCCKCFGWSSGHVCTSYTPHHMLKMVHYIHIPCMPQQHVHKHCHISFPNKDKLPTWNIKRWSHLQSAWGVSNENVQA
jgi:hypothetical protein